MRCHIGKSQKQGLIFVCCFLIRNPFLGTGREQIRAVATVQLVGNQLIAIPYGVAMGTFGYAGVVFLTYMNLYECSPDEEMRELARMSMDTLLMNVIADTTENGYTNLK